MCLQMEKKKLTIVRNWKKKEERILNSYLESVLCSEENCFVEFTISLSEARGLKGVRKDKRMPLGVRQCLIDCLRLLIMLG